MLGVYNHYYTILQQRSQVFGLFELAPLDERVEESCSTGFACDCSPAADSAGWASPLPVSDVSLPGDLGGDMSILSSVCKAYKGGRVDIW